MHQADGDGPQPLRDQDGKGLSWERIRSDLRPAVFEGADDSVAWPRVRHLRSGSVSGSILPALECPIDVMSVHGRQLEVAWWSAEDGRTFDVRRIDRSGEAFNQATANLARVGQARWRVLACDHGLLDYRFDQALWAEEFLGLEGQGVSPSKLGATGGFGTPSKLGATGRRWRMDFPV